MKKLIEILTHISRVMLEVESEKKQLAMLQYYEEPLLINPKTTIHTCGTSACVAGYAVLDREVMKLAGTREPSALWDNMNEMGSVGIKLFCSRIVGSVFLERSEDRLAYAQDTGLFSWFELDEIEHLNTDDPSPSAAADYIDLLVKELKNPKNDCERPLD